MKRGSQLPVAAEANTRAMSIMRRVVRVLKPSPPFEESLIVGWREWVGLPEFDVPALKAKIDTGARTSALHAHDLVVADSSEGLVATFSIRPGGDPQEMVPVEAYVIDQRSIRSSNGGDELRPVIMTNLRLGRSTWPIEVTLTDRELMGFPMLVGRSALRNRCLVDPNRSFCTGAQPVRDTPKSYTRESNQR